MSKLLSISRTSNPFEKSIFMTNPTSQGHCEDASRQYFIVTEPIYMCIYMYLSIGKLETTEIGVFKRQINSQSSQILKSISLDSLISNTRLADG